MTKLVKGVAYFWHINMLARITLKLPMTILRIYKMFEKYLTFEIA